MADQARKTVGQYVEWIGKYVEAALEDMNNMRAAQQQATGACWHGTGCSLAIVHSGGLTPRLQRECVNAAPRGRADMFLTRDPYQLRRSSLAVCA